MSFSTAECKTALDTWASTSTNCAHEIANPENGAWKRLRKFKDSSDRWVREFTRKDLEDDGGRIYVIENNSGLEISLSNPAELWYYQFETRGDVMDESFAYLTIVSKSFWESTGCIDSEHISDQLGVLLPEGSYEDCESTFSFKGSDDEARAALNAAGFIEKNLFDNE